jgi:hypothetical protein
MQHVERLVKRHTAAGKDFFTTPSINTLFMQETQSFFPVLQKRHTVPDKTNSRQKWLTLPHHPGTAQNQTHFLLDGVSPNFLY